MALSSDRGTMNQKVDQGYGMVCDISGNPVDGLVVGSTNQEHGIIKRRDGGRADCASFPVGTLLRILPNHACATAAPHERYFVVNGDLEIVSTWPRFNGW
jgi:D-serine deaminase-like pyridoxal phosphate-dependent protein